MPTYAGIALDGQNGLGLVSTLMPQAREIPASSFWLTVAGVLAFGGWVLGPSLFRD